MFEQYQIRIEEKQQPRQILNALLAVITGLLALVYPDLLYIIAGGYLLALGILFLIFQVPAAISAFPIVAGALVFVFPDLLPVTFGVFLGIFGLLMLFAFQFSIFGALTLILALVTFMNPDWISYMIAAFMLLYGVTNTIRWFRQR
jgi:hypothetical protein